MEFKEKLFGVGSIGFWLVSIYFLYQTYQVILQRQTESETYPRFGDFYEALVYLVILVACREICTRFLFRSIGERLISKTAADRAERVDRFAVVTFKLVYFILATGYGFWLLRFEPWFPKSLGGAVWDRNQLWEGIPHQESTPGMRFYYMVSMSYHFHSLVYHAVILPRRNDYMEMLTHHFLAIFLIAFSYMLNYLRIGSLVLLVHDLPDIPGYAVKASVVTPYTKTTLSIYAGLLLVWGYARLYVFPVDVIASTVSEETYAAEYNGQDYGRYALTSMLIGLFVMHVYWYVLFLFMGFRYTKVGKTEDIQQKLGNDKKDGAEQDAEIVNPKAEVLKQRKNGVSTPVNGAAQANGFLNGHSASNGLYSNGNTANGFAPVAAGNGSLAMSGAK